MKKVRPADGIPVVPHIAAPDELDARHAALKAKLQEADPEFKREWEAWAAAHPALAHEVNRAAAWFQLTVNPLTGYSIEETTETMRGLLLNFKMGLAMAEITEAFLAEKH
jgi:hypothetical protein